MSGREAPRLSFAEAQTFLGQYWGKQSGVLRKTQLLDAGQVFRALVVASDMYRESGKSAPRMCRTMTAGRFVPVARGAKYSAWTMLFSASGVTTGDGNLTFETV